jgi:hypothetical protein
MRGRAAVARVLFVALLTVPMAPVAQDDRTFTGVITDDSCAKGGHAQMRMGPTDAECTRLCVLYHAGKYVLQDGSRVYLLSDQKRPAEFAGRRVRVVGTLEAKTNTIRLTSIAETK